MAGLRLIRNPTKDQWATLLARPYADNSKAIQIASEILADVKRRGDASLTELAAKFDGFVPATFQVDETLIDKAGSLLPQELKNAMEQAAANIRRFHQVQVTKEPVMQTMPGITCWRKSVPIQHVGLYVPGGSAPLFSTVLMLGIPAQLAGCKEIILCTPPSQLHKATGGIHPAILYAAQISGVRQVYAVGGAQAIAAMAFGTPGIPRVDKIFGPGNQYVTAAKQLVQLEGVAIDMPAGPSEVCVIADETADPGFVAADLLSQAEHGADSQVVLITTSENLYEKVQAELDVQLQHLPRAETAIQALRQSRAFLVKDMNEALALANVYAAEHLIICCRDAAALADGVINAGSVFIGNYSPESVGDYASGTNHTLPTNGAARAYSGVSVDSFLKNISFQQLSPEGLQAVGNTVVAMAEAEGLQAHANAVKLRLNV